jgi:hypothetical protein
LRVQLQRRHDLVLELVRRAKGAPCSLAFDEALEGFVLGTSFRIGFTGVPLPVLADFEEGQHRDAELRRRAVFQFRDRPSGRPIYGPIAVADEQHDCLAVTDAQHAFVARR